MPEIARWSIFQPLTPRSHARLRDAVTHDGLTVGQTIQSRAIQGISVTAADLCPDAPKQTIEIGTPFEDQPQ